MRHSAHTRPLVFFPRFELGVDDDDCGEAVGECEVVVVVVCLRAPQPSLPARLRWPWLMLRFAADSDDLGDEEATACESCAASWDDSAPGGSRMADEVVVVVVVVVDDEDELLWLWLWLAAASWMSRRAA